MGYELHKLQTPKRLRLNRVQSAGRDAEFSKYKRPPPGYLYGKLRDLHDVKIAGSHDVRLDDS